MKDVLRPAFMLFLLLSLMVLAFYNDIIRYFFNRAG